MERRSRAQIVEIKAAQCRALDGILALVDESCYPRRARIWPNPGITLAGTADRLEQVSRKVITPEPRRARPVVFCSEASVYAGKGCNG